MRALRMLVVASIAVSLTVPSVQANEAAATDLSGVEPERADIAHAIRLREEQGLDASLETVMRAAKDAEAYPDMTWSIPMSTAEAAEIQRRLRVWESVLPGLETVEKDPDWAGWWLDNSRGGRPVFQFVGDIGTKSETLSRLVPDGVEVDVVQVRYTLARLQGERDALIAAADELLREGVDLTAGGIDVRGNRVAVSVDGLTPETRPLIDDRMTVDFTLRDRGRGHADHNCPESTCMPFKAGIGITDTNGNWPCTVGYLARRTDVSPDKLVFVTAGHCIVAGTAGPWEHGTAPVGYSAGNGSIYAWDDHENADVGLVNTGQLSNPPTVRNNLLVNHVTEQVLPIKYTRTWSAQTPGLIVCRMGRTTQHECGTISDNDETMESELSGHGWVWIDHTIIYGRDAVGGDSGGPMFIVVAPDLDPPYAVLFGTHVHSFPEKSSIDPSGDGWYSPQDREINVLNNKGAVIVPCTTSSCGLP